MAKETGMTLKHVGHSRGKQGEVGGRSVLMGMGKGARGEEA